MAKQKENVTGGGSIHSNKYIGGGGMNGHSERDDSSLNTTPNSK